MSSPSVGVVEGLGGSQKTIAARTVVVVWFATWKVCCIDISVVSKVSGPVFHQLESVQETNVLG